MNVSPVKTNNIQVGLKKLTETAITPRYLTDGAAGFDFHADVADTIYLTSGSTVKINTGLAMAIPANFELQIRSRSGLAKRGVMVTNAPGTVDSDYRGEICIILSNYGPDLLTVNPGDRIAQGIVAPVFQAHFELKDELDETERGSQGFGSTGVSA